MLPLLGEVADPVGESGAGLGALAETARQLGFRATAVRIAPGRLGEVALPAVAHLSAGHYVTLFEQLADGVIVGDPESGIRPLNLAELAHTWSGQLLVLVRQTGSRKRR